MAACALTRADIAVEPASRPDTIACRLPDGAGVVVSRYGGQVLSWSDANGRELLYLSPTSSGANGTPVRGGMPVCFPQFAARGPLPKHGFSRTLAWTQVGEPAGAAVQLQLREQPQTLAVWPHRFQLDLRVECSARHLRVTLQVQNTDAHAWSFTAALHTYYRVDAVAAAALLGLRGVRYEDALAGGRRVDATEPTPSLDRAIDRVYLAAPRSLTLNDGARQLEILQGGFADTVVWNPGPGAAASLGDMPPGDEQHMLCVEAAQVADPVALRPGETWQGWQETQLR
jgi:glucose-6-phosphate 1-epimerase